MPALAWPLALVLAAACNAAAASRQVQLRAADGVALAASVYDAPVPSAPAVVLVHMLTRTKEDWRPFAERLQAAGTTALAFDLRGHGQSEGSSAPAAAMALDVQAALKWLAERPDGGSARVAVVGASLGATLAVLAAAEAPAVRGLVLLSPAADYRGLRLEPAVKKYGARPLLAVASSDDPYALRTVRALTGEATPNAMRESRVSAVAAHGTQLLDRDPELTAALVDWLRRTLLS